jgi:hypothetical protein
MLRHNIVVYEEWPTMELRSRTRSVVTLWRVLCLINILTKVIPHNLTLINFLFQSLARVSIFTTNAESHVL